MLFIYPTTFRNRSGNAIGLNFGYFRMTTKVGVPPCLKFNVHLQKIFRSLRSRRYTFNFFPARFARGSTPSIFSPLASLAEVHLKNFPLATLAEVHLQFFSRSLRSRKYTLKIFRSLRSQRYTLNFKFLLTPYPKPFFGPTQRLRSTCGTYGNPYVNCF